MNNYPEHAKLSQIKHESSVVQDFIDWLYDEAKLAIFEITDYDHFPTHKSREQIMAEYFNIDLDKLSQEKDRMLGEWRESQGL